VFVSDPGKGLLKHKVIDFENGWLEQETQLGAVLALEPMADFKQRNANDKIERRKTLENFLGYFSPYKKSFLNLFFVMLIVPSYKHSCPLYLNQLLMWVFKPRI
jgi:ATP-binding cassette, subfamily B, bacterial